MTSAAATLTVRPGTRTDCVELCDLLNAIIEAGGTTALEVPFEEAGLAEKIIDARDMISLLVAIDPSNAIAGFQWLSRQSTLPSDWGDIATFARIAPKQPGVGRALFARTRAVAVEAGLVAINATIRADNTGGLAFYGKMGFETYDVRLAVAMADGTPVDRVLKRHLLT